MGSGNQIDGSGTNDLTATRMSLLHWVSRVSRPNWVNRWTVPNGTTTITGDWSFDEAALQAAILSLPPILGRRVALPQATVGMGRWPAGGMPSSPHS